MYPQRFPFQNKKPNSQLPPSQTQHYFPNVQLHSNPNQMAPNIRQPFYNNQYSLDYNPPRGGRSPRRNQTGYRGNQRPKNQIRPRTFVQQQNLELQDIVPDTKNDATHNNSKLFVCPGCLLNYDCFLRNNQYVGKVPLILNCKHTVCQDCIIKSFNTGNVLCVVCKNPSMIHQRDLQENPQGIFLPNFYIIGFILWSKTQDSVSMNVTLVPVKNPNLFSPNKVVSENMCCFLSCNKRAILACRECNDVYCEECCTTVHKSAKSLWSHKQEHIISTKFSSTLKKCLEHNMDIEYLCLNCEIGACCYCFIEKHPNHDKTQLSKLSDEEYSIMLKYKEKTIENLRKLSSTQKRILNIQQSGTTIVQQKMNEYFIGLHSRLQFIEKNLQKLVSNHQNVGGINKSLENIQLQVESHIDTIKDILASCENLDDRKINLREILKNLEKCQNIPCYLLNGGQGNELIKFDVNPTLDNIEDYFKISQSDPVEYQLVCEKDLPVDYQDFPDVEIQSDIESCLSFPSTNELSGFCREKKNLRVQKKRIGNTSNSVQTEKVDVTHIESLECFYVQQKKLQYKLYQLNREIDNFAKIAPRVYHSILAVNDLCLALYETGKEKFWSRGRIVDIINGENGPIYEIFFIDYGNTHHINITKIREISPVFAQRKPFAIHCELFNPSGSSWGKNAHVHMGKIINGKDVFMNVKKVFSGIHEVELNVSSSDGGVTSVIDILINTFSDTLSTYSNSSKMFNANVLMENSLSHENIFMNNYIIFSNSVDFQKNQIENVVIANIVDPHNIFVHIAKNKDALNKMNYSMNIFYKKQDYSSKFIPIEGSFVIVKHKDPVRGNVHRALIKKNCAVTEEANVYFVDWGINVTVPWESMRLLKEDFIKLESQAILVKLVHVEPFDKSHTWSEQSVQFLQKYFITQDILKMHVHTVEPLEVALFEQNINVNICINALLVSSNLAISTGKVSQTVEWPQDIPSDKIIPDDGFVSSLLKKVLEDSDSDDGDEETKNIVKQQIDVIKFVNPDLIYIKFVRTEKSEETLHNELQAFYMNEHKRQELWNIDDICVVLYGNAYHRGRILDIKDKKYKINMYDKMMEVETSEENLFVYHKYFNKFPNVVFKAHLANIAPAGGDKWSMASIEAVQKIFDTYQEIFATKVSGDSLNKSIPMKIWYTVVEIRDALEASVRKYKCINDILVKMGYAYKKYVGNNATENTKEELDMNKGEMKDDNQSDNQDGDLSAEYSSTKSKNEMEINSKLEISKSWIDILEEEEEQVNTQNESPYHTKEAEISDWKPAFPIEKRDFNAWITCAESEGILYIRAEMYQEIYKNLEKNYKEYFENNTELNRDEHNWQPGQICTIASNGFWYRGKIHQVVTPKEIVAIMIDYGSDHNVSPECLYREILYPEIPAFASQIKLDKVFAKSGKWLTSDYETFLSIVPEYVRIVIKGPINVQVPLAEVYDGEGVSVNDLLVEKCPNLSRYLEEEMPDSDEENVVIEEELIECTENISIGKPVSTLRDSTGISMYKTPVDTTSFHYKYETISKKDRTLVTIMAIMTYNKVVLKLPNKRLEDDISKFTKKIQPLAKSQPLIEDIQVGMPCICPYSGDGLWYRAKIHNTSGLDCGYAIVFFVDFGNTESVTVNMIRMMKPEWFHFPATCQMAVLNFELKTSNHKEYVYQHTQKLFDTNKMCEVVSSDPLTVHLFNENGELNYQSLIQSGLIKIA